MAIPVNDILEDVENLKSSARANTTFGDYDEALADLEKAIKWLCIELKDIEGQESISTDSKESRRNEIVRQLADCYGMAGGVYRRKAKEDKSFLDKSIEMYDKGSDLEKEKSYNVNNSYNLINSIVVRLLRDPNSLSVQKTQIQEALEIIQKQVEVKRRSEWWAWADLGLLYILNGKSTEALGVYENFRNTGARAKEYKSTIAILDVLKQALTTINPIIVEALSEAIQYLKRYKPER